MSLLICRQRVAIHCSLRPIWNAAPGSSCTGLPSVSSRDGVRCCRRRGRRARGGIRTTHIARDARGGRSRKLRAGCRRTQRTAEPDHRDSRVLDRSRPVPPILQPHSFAGPMPAAGLQRRSIFLATATPKMTRIMPFPVVAAARGELAELRVSFPFDRRLIGRRRSDYVGARLLSATRREQSSRDFITTHT